MSNVVKKVKKQVANTGFFQILLGDYVLKQEAVVGKPPEWKFMAIIARNAKLSGCLGQIFARLGSKMANKLLIFNNFTLVSQS